MTVVFLQPQEVIDQDRAILLTNISAEKLQGLGQMVVGVKAVECPYSVGPLMAAFLQGEHFVETLAIFEEGFNRSGESLD